MTSRADRLVEQATTRGAHRYAFPVQSGQVSIWVTLGVAILGIVGVIIGQFINAWREERRLDRDAQRGHAQNWLTQRLDSYVDLVVAMYEWLDSLQAVVRPRNNNATPLPELIERCVAAGQRAGRAMVRVGLIGSSTAVARAKTIGRDLKALQGDILDENSMDPVGALENLEIELTGLVATLGVEFDTSGVRRDGINRKANDTP